MINIVCSNPNSAVHILNSLQHPVTNKFIIILYTMRQNAAEVSPPYRHPIREVKANEVVLCVSNMPDLEVLLSVVDSTAELVITYTGGFLQELPPQIIEKLMNKVSGKVKFFMRRGKCDQKFIEQQLTDSQFTGEVQVELWG